MAASINASARSRKSRLRQAGPMSEINVTPLVDVMLVLLIIFMVTAPLLTVGVPVNLPKTQAAQLNDQKEPITISVNAQGDVYLQETKMALDELVPKVQAILQADPDNKVYIRGDGDSRYAQVVGVMGALNSAGITKVALLTEMPNKTSESPNSSTTRKKNSGRKIT